MKTTLHTLMKNTKGTKFVFASAHKKIKDYKEQVLTYMGTRTEVRNTEVLRGGKVVTISKPYSIFIIQDESGKTIEFDHTWSDVAIRIII